MPIERGVSKKSIIIAAIVVSILIYLAGLFSGLYAKKIIDANVEEDMGFLKRYTDVSTLDLKNMLLLQFYADKMQDCRFSEMYLGQLYQQLNPYWQKLPKRLEAYEKGGQVTDEYIGLKREYIRLSLRLWLTANYNHNVCNTTNFIPMLYFYTKDCESCVEQGQILDSFNKEGKFADKNIFVFPIDGYFEDDTVYLLKQYYNITAYPAIIMNKKMIQKRIIPESDILKII